MSSKFIITFSVIIAVFLVIDFYLWKALKNGPQKIVNKLVRWFIPASTLVFVLSLINLISKAGNLENTSSYFINLLMALSLGFFFTKLIAMFFFIVEDLSRISFFSFKYITKNKAETVDFTERRNFVRNMTLGVATLPFVGSIVAATKGKYNFHVKKMDLAYKRLPKSFDGLKVVFFTDFHAGSFDDFEQVKNGLALINEANPDLIFFTGDLVNNRAAEVKPYKELFENLNARYGKYAILGNHDYGDYIPFDSEEERQENLNEITEFYNETGFQLLNNESITINRKEDAIDIIGVENWGSGVFPKYGDVEKAIDGTEDRFNIFLSHDPDHWEYILKDHPKHIDLTLSGHTHGAQFGIDIPGIKWSPVKYRYKRWLGLYKKNNRHLFVSKGFGFLGYPGRLGMWPEIVVLKLHHSPTV